MTDVERAHTPEGRALDAALARPGIRALLGEEKTDG